MTRFYNLCLTVLSSLYKDPLLPLKFLRFLKQHGIKRTMEVLKFRLASSCYYSQNHYQTKIIKRKKKE